MDEKMRMFVDKKRTEHTIEHGVEKGFPRETLSIFSDPRGRIVVADIIQQGKYRIEPPRICLVPKKNSTEMRKVYANSPLDRFILAQINSIYYELYHNMIHPCCISYQKGIGVSRIVKDVVKKLDNGMSGYKADLHKYFDSVNLETIEEYLKKMDTNSPLDKLLWEYYHDNTVIDEEGKVIEKYKSLAQGCAFGTLLANIVLRDIDEALSNLDILYYRYADDLLMLGPDAEKAMKTLQAMLPAKGLTLNPKKVMKIDPDTPFTFLGCTIQGNHVTISNESVQDYKDRIRKITKHKKGDVGNRKAQERAIKKINDYVYNNCLEDKSQFGWMNYFAPIVTEQSQMKELDEFTKDHLKSMYTGKWNHTTNLHKTSNEDLQKMGYHSMVQMWKLRNISKAVYETELRTA